MGALKFLSTLQQKVDPKEIIEKGLMFVDATINSRPSKSTLIDSGATHNFIADQEARRLGLTIGKDSRKMKVVILRPCLVWKFLSPLQIRDLDRRNGPCRGLHG